MMHFISIERLHKSYLVPNNSSVERVEIINDFNLSVEQREFVTFVGPNGCGKTTLLNSIAGLSDIDSGTIRIDGRPPQQTKIGYVFQNFQLSFLPWKQNIDNIAFPLELQGLEKKQRRKIVEDFLGKIDFNLPLHSYPYQLSGGQQQLLAIARALIFEPSVLLLDEPFNQLDFQTRMAMQDKLIDIHQKTQTTILFVSHDLDEAIILGDKVVFLSRRPTRILDVIDNPLPKNRNHDVVKLQEFFSVKNIGLSILERAFKS
jgi:NitT/TauT family transport system ATP-binding protein